MADLSNIEWCDRTQNFWEGCQHASPGCDNCFAETRNKRFGGGLAPNWGPGAPRRLTSPANRRKPHRWNKAHSAFYAEHGRRQRVFCSSLSDWLDNAVPIEWFIELLDTIRLTPNLDWLLLTKRIGNFQNRMREAKHAIDFDKQRDLWLFVKCWANGEDVPEHVYVGATIVNQLEADRDIPKLLATPARIRFLSMEPLLGLVDLRFPIVKAAPPENIHNMTIAEIDECASIAARAIYHAKTRTVDWVISGGESGPGARASHPRWHRSLRDQCVAAGVPYLFKQWGEWANAEAARLDLNTCYDTSRAGGWVEMDGFFSQGEMASPGDSRAAHVFKIGKKAAGRLLDGRIWNQFPLQLPVAPMAVNREVEAING